MRHLMNICGGFLLAVLWFDLMFDVQIMAYADVSHAPDAVLQSIANYYARVTLDAWPMNWLVGLAMLTAVVLSVYQIYLQPGVNGRLVLSSVFISVPVVLAQVSVFPAAQQLAQRGDNLILQSELAWQICLAHIICFVSVTIFLLLQNMQQLPWSNKKVVSSFEAPE